MNLNPLRRFGVHAWLGLSLVCVLPWAMAQSNWPTKPIKIGRAHVGLQIGRGDRP